MDIGCHEMRLAGGKGKVDKGDKWCNVLWCVYW